MKICLAFILSLFSKAVYASGADVPTGLYLFFGATLLVVFLFTASRLDKLVRQKKNKPKNDNKDQH